MFHQIFYVVYLPSAATEKSVKDTEVKTDSTVMRSEVGNERKELTKKTFKRLQIYKSTVDSAESLIIGCVLVQIFEVHELV